MNIRTINHNSLSIMALSDINLMFNPIIRKEAKMIT